MRPVVLGMNNPHSDDPEDALSPTFRGSAGRRLYQMIRESDPTVSEADYLCCLDRRNLVSEGDWSNAHARVFATDMVTSLQGRWVVMLGSLVPSALGLKHDGKWYQWHDGKGLTFCVVPHPSGLNRLYNDAGYRRQTGTLLVSLIRRQQCAT